MRCLIAGSADWYLSFCDWLARLIVIFQFPFQLPVNGMACCAVDTMGQSSVMSRIIFMVFIFGRKRVSLVRSDIDNTAARFGPYPLHIAGGSCDHTCNM
jgi:hypothetical protein